MSEQLVIQTKDLVYHRTGMTIVDRFSFGIPKGQIVGVIGPNGGGKTTLLKLLLGLLDPISGSILVLGKDPRSVSVRRKLAYVAQRGGLIDPMFPATVEEVVRSGGILRHTKMEDLELTLTLLKISHLRGRFFGQLSGGERQRALIARALMSDPEILFLDEPTDGLDPETRESFFDLLHTLKQTREMTIILVSHDVHSIAKHADSAICLKHEQICHGEGECHLTVEELRNVFHGAKEIETHHYA